MRGSNTVVRRAAGLGLALATTAAVVAAGPAAQAAAQPQPLFTLRPLAPIALGPHTTDAYGSGLWFMTNATTAVHAKLRIDVHELAKVAKVSYSPNCTLADQVVSCDDTLDPISSGDAVPQHTNISFSALPGSNPGASGHYVVSVTSDEATVTGGTGVVHAGAPSLVTAPLVAHKGLKPGAVVTEPITVTNSGNLSAAGAEIMIQLTPGLDFARKFRNCEYWSAGGIFAGALCHFGGAVRPGETFALATPLQIKVLPNDLRASVEIWTLPEGDPNFARVPAAKRPAKAPLLGLKVQKCGHATTAPASHLGIWQEMVDNAVLARIDAKNTADFGVRGARVSGAAGTVVPVTVGAFNHGPASVFLLPGEINNPLRFTVPPGTTVTRAPSACRPETPAARAYDCDFTIWPVSNGAKSSYTFQLRIDTVIPHATGRFELTQQLSFDPNHANDAAPVVVN